MALALVCRGEDLVEILFGFADILAHHLREVDAVEVEPQRIRDDFGSHGLSGAGAAEEQRGDTETVRELACEAPFV